MRNYVKEYGAGVLAAGLMYGGIGQIIEVVRDPIAIGVMRVVNAIIRQGFRDQMELSHFGPVPWAVYARFTAIGIIIVVVGFLIGLWGNYRNERRLNPSK